MDAHRLVEDGFLEAGEAGLDQGDAEPRNGTTWKIGDAARRTQASTASPDGEGDDLDGGDHVLGLDHRVGRQGRKRDGLVDEVETLDRVAVDDAEAGGIGRKLARPVKARPRLTFAPASGRATASAASFSTMSPGSSRATTLSRPADASAATSASVSTRPFFRVAVAELEAVRQDRARRLGERHVAELHAASALPPRRSPAAR